MSDSTCKSTRSVNCITAALLALCALPTLADDGKVRYVSGSGQDSGDCLNKFRPCRTLSYAIGRAGKGDIFWVAEGEYSIRNTAQLGELMALNGRIKAGYDKHTGFADRTASEKTVLIGVPPAMRERFEAAGFSVIADTKGFDAATPQEAHRMRTFAAQITAAEKSHAAAPCTAGQASGFPCQSISLHSQLSLGQLQPASSRGADLWGYTDLNTGREYVVFGMDNGVAVVDVTDPQAPVQVAYATGNNTIWREVTIYQTYDQTAKRWRAYAYITVDGNVPDRLMVLDLSGLPNSVEQVNFVSDFGASHTDYLINADYTFGIPETTGGAQLVISGARSTNGGNYRLYSLAQPRAPQILGLGSAGYTHDVASFGVTDSRKNTQCVNAATAAKCQVLADFNEGSIEVWDVTAPTAVRFLGRQSYANVAYTHSGWWTEDGRYLLAHDELDEQTFGLNPIVRVFDMSNLAAPSLVGNWTGPNRAIDHNGYARGNRYYLSHYSEGLTVLDITNPVAPTRVGYFDTFPASAQTSFVGAWGAYPFFASGTVAMGDINSGLFLLRNETLNVPQGTLAFTTPSVSAAEGDSVTLNVSRTGGSTGAVAVQLDYLHGSSDAGDVVLTSQTLNWAAGDVLDKSVTIGLNSDAQPENLELLLVRLKNPQGGATINYPDTAYVRIAEFGAITRLRLLDPTVTVNEVRGRAQIVVTRQGSLNGSAALNFATVPNTTYTAFTAQQGTLTWAASDGSAKTIAIDFDSSRLQPGQTGTFQVELSAASGAELENAAGATATSLTATVNVVDVAPPAPPAAPRRSGGGGIDALWALVLAGLLGGRATSRNRGLAAQA